MAKPKDETMSETKPAPSAPPKASREERISSIAAERRRLSFGALSVEDSIAVATAQVDADDANS